MAFIFFFFKFSAFAHPFPIPSAGVVEREIEREYEAMPLELDKFIPPFQIEIPEEKLEFPEGKKVFLESVQIQGNDVISCVEIASWLNDRLNQDFSIQDIYELCHAVDQYYASKGYFLARAYPPPQTIENGELAIEVIEGKLGNIQVIGNEYYQTFFIQSYFLPLQDRPLHYDEFLRALLLLNDNMDLRAGIIFEKGEEFGTADVIIRVSDSCPVHLYLNGNDYGRNLMTHTRFGGRLDWGNFFTNGDMISIADVLGLPINALYFNDVTYTIPLNRCGTSLELAYLFSKFKIEELESLHLRGRSDIATVQLNQALIRTRTLSVDLFAYFDYKQIQNFVFSHRSSFDKLRVLTFGATLDQFNAGWARNYLTVQLAAGIPDFLWGLKSVDRESSRRGGGGRFFRLNIDYDRLQYLPYGCFFYFHGSGQWSPNKLTLPEQLYIGGDGTVRGYPLAAALGDSGYYLNFEFRFPPPLIADRKFLFCNKTCREIFQFDLFLDQGGVFRQSDRHTFLCGTGLGMRVNGPFSLTFSIDVGFPLSHRKLSREVFTYMKLTGQPF